MMAQWPMMAARTGLDTARGQLAVSRGRCCWLRARSSGPAPGGVFAGQLFGTRDTWADDPDMTFHARHQVGVLLEGLDILARKHPSAPASR